MKRKDNFPAPAYRRSETPISRRSRAVEYRHVRYIPQTHSKDADYEADAVDESESLSVPSFADRSLKEEEKKPEKAGWAAGRKARREDVAERILKEPRISAAQYVFNPAEAMSEMSSCEDVMMSRGTILFLHILKWAAFGICMASWAGHLINIHAFSIASMSFSEEAYYAFITGTAGFIADYVCLGVTGLLSGFWQKDFSMLRINSFRSPCCISQMMLFLAAAVLFHSVPVLALILVVIAGTEGIMLRFYSYLLACRYSRGKITITLVVNTIIAVLLFLLFASLFLSGIQQLLEKVLQI